LNGQQTKGGVAQMKKLDPGYILREEAKKIAQEICISLYHHCEEKGLCIVGDLRRDRSKVKSIDIVCIPKTINMDTDLFTFGPVRVDGFVKLVNSWLRMKGDPLKGKYTQRLHPEHDITINLYMVTRDNYGLMVMFRTGPVEYSKRMIDKETKKVGMESKGGYLRWEGTDVVVPTPTEEEFYRLVQEPWIKPVFRIK